ncbi:uncharacterized protein SRS1_15814 [Sporisorium reilianum f. sp. reilianum]|uniref:Ubiquitin-like-conjugating enzyme ATG10 n=1 Tax=Sporisorium reilianum f. sp. reilianum TaxID=72559 RepID=A0A2N8UJ73_9BASI|nr:uncharacterized protein SRS1_15814 [Sporisorium reilianum f. sp. reilianum]
MTALDAAAASTRISFAQFQTFSLAYLAHRDRLFLSPTPTALSWLTYATQWVWLPPVYPGTAFEATACLSRSFSVAVPTSALHVDAQDATLHLEVEEDEAVAAEARETVTVHQTVSWSSVWRVPVLHFHAHTAGGEPVSLSHLARVGVVHSHGTLRAQGGVEDRLDMQQQQQQPGGVAAISVADHPRTALPSYFLHPCHTEAALRASLHRGDEEDAGWAYMSAFISLCASAVEMRAG